MTRVFYWAFGPLVLVVGCGLAAADDREVTSEQQAAVSGAADETEQPARPATLPDYTKGDAVPNATQIWSLGPTGLEGVWAGGFGGDQFLVLKVLPGSPAAGRILPGNVLLGVDGTAFAPGGHLGVIVGNAIIEAEKEERGGRLAFSVWRDSNWAKRNGGLDSDRIDLDDVFNASAAGDALYDWQPQAAKEHAVQDQKFQEFPILGSTSDVELTLRVFPPYADTAPFDCPKTKQILEDAWQVLEKHFSNDPKHPNTDRGAFLRAIALLASGKPEHRELVKKWVRSPEAKAWQPSFVGSIDMMKPQGYLSWRAGFVGLPCAIYYEATGDDYVLPALEEWAVKTAMGQSHCGTWGHTFAWPAFNGGQLHGMNPGYGALNAAGNHCFFLIALAQKLGVKHPEVDAAVERARRFFGSYVDQGAIPYGDHPAADTDDSNGKNSGTAFAMKCLGDGEAAKYFATMAAHASFTARGGHGHDWHTNWSSWAASLVGPEVRTLAERNMRWRRTLCRKHDGSFVYHSPTGSKYGELIDATTTEVLHQAVALRQTLITGKNPDESLWLSDRELNQFLASAQPQFNDPLLDAKAGKPWPERSTDELFELLDIFKPKMRRLVAAELGKRFQAGEQAIADRLVILLGTESPRMRDGGLRGLAACGTDTVLANLSTIVKLLQDPEDFVRITAIAAVSRAATDAETQQALLVATVAPPTAVAPNSVRNAIQTPLFGGDTLLAKKPFAAGFDESLIRDALEHVLTLDPAGKSFLGARAKDWDQDTVVRLAAPLVYIAENEQLGDQMFASRSAPAQALLQRFGYREGFSSSAFQLSRQAALPRNLRGRVTVINVGKKPLVNPAFIRQDPAAFRGFVGSMQTVLIDDPLFSVFELQGEQKVPVPMAQLLPLVVATREESSRPSIAADVKRFFLGRLDAAESPEKKLALCRETLGDTSRLTTFRKLAAMDFLVEQLGPDVLDDLVPVLGRHDWRVRDQALTHAATLAAADGGKALAGRFAAARDPAVQAGILMALGEARAAAGLPPAVAAFTHDDTAVRAAAIVAAGRIGGATMVAPILAHFQQANAAADLRACEDALMALRADRAVADQVRDLLLAALPDAEDPRRESLHWMLGQCGDAPSLAALEKAGTTKAADEFRSVVSGLSYSPAMEADAALLRLAKSDKKKAPLVAAESVRRMVLGPKGYGDRTADQRIAFAEAMLGLASDPRLIAYLGTTGLPRAMPILVDQLRQGSGSSAESVIANAEAMQDLSPADAKVVAQALQDVMEFIEVTKLRGGAAGKDFREYPRAKALQARAGKALVRLHKPEAAPISGFKDADLDL